jgi:hypothetical protein
MRQRRLMMSKWFQPIIDKYESKRRAWKYKENVYFKTSIVNDRHAIELLKGPYKGIIWTFGDISIEEDLGFKGAQARYEIEILNPELTDRAKEKHMCDIEFTKLTGNILLVILEKIIAKQADNYFNENLNEEHRENYSEEPTAERTVSQESPSVPKKRVSSRKAREDSV